MSSDAQGASALDNQDASAAFKGQPADQGPPDTEGALLLLVAWRRSCALRVEVQDDVVVAVTVEIDWVDTGILGIASRKAAACRLDHEAGGTQVDLRYVEGSRAEQSHRYDTLVLQVDSVRVAEGLDVDSNC